jgi:hypothetical protein
MKRLFVLIVLVAAATPRASAVPLPSLTGPLDSEPLECLELSPVAVHVPGVDLDDAISLDVALVADRGVTTDRAVAIAGRAAEAYSPLNVSVRIASVQHADLSGEDAQGLMDQTKALMGGTRPAGADIVATVTSVDIAAADQTAVLGLADCIGGVRFASHAFLVIEDPVITLEIPDDGVSVGPISFEGNLAGKTLAHEAGHLLGAQHHYANCVEGVTTEPTEVSPCTLMFNDADFMSISFGTLESAVVRGHAEIYARP